MIKNFQFIQCLRIIPSGKEPLTLMLTSAHQCVRTCSTFLPHLGDPHSILHTETLSLSDRQWFSPLGELCTNIPAPVLHIQATCGDDLFCECPRLLDTCRNELADLLEPPEQCELEGGCPIIVIGYVAPAVVTTDDNHYALLPMIQ